MGDSTSGNAALVRRIIQLENERDELQRDIETLCIQQSGQSGTVDLLARLQARRVSGLEQELESCKQKLAHCIKENSKLQDELSQVYQIKARFADLYEEELEKNKEVEKEVKFFQGKVASALAERDRALIEVDKANFREDTLTNELKELKDRIKLMEIENGDQYQYCLSLQQALDELKSSDEIYCQVMGKFWRIRGVASPAIEMEVDDSLPWKDKALCLLEDDDSHWTFGNHEAKSMDAQKPAELVESKLVCLQEEVAMLSSTAENLFLQKEKESEARGYAEAKLATLEAQLTQLKEGLVVELVQLRSWHVSTKEIVNASLQDARHCLDTFSKMVSEVLDNGIFTSVCQTDANDVKDGDALCNADVRDSNSCKNDDATLEDGRENVEGEKQTFSMDDIEEVHFADKGVVENHPAVVAQDNNRAYIQAMQEKVAALLLLSQEEERYILKEKMVKGLEEQISHLNQKLSQVTSEKVEALMEVAQLKQDVQLLQDEQRQLIQLLQQHRSTSASGRLLPAIWAECSASTQSQEIQNSDGNQRKPKSSQEGMVKRNWWTSSYTAGLKILGTDSSSKTSGNKKDDAIDNARLRIENAAHQEQLANLHQLTKSIHRLAASLAQVFNSLCDEQTEAALKEAVRTVEGVASEAQHLKVALSCCLPISWSGEISSEPPSPATEQNYLVDTDATKSLSDPTLVGMVMVEVLLGTCKMQKTTLESRLRAISCVVDDS